MEQGVISVWHLKKFQLFYRIGRIGEYGDKNMLKRINHTFLQNILCLTAALALSVVLFHTYLSSFFSYTAPYTALEIVGTAEKNCQSYGADIRILNIKINDRPVPFSEFQQEGNWQTLDEIAIAVLNLLSPVSLVYTAADARTLEIEVQKAGGIRNRPDLAKPTALYKH